MNAAKFSDLVTCLTGDQSPRVWSLLVTVFGELAQNDGTQISGTLLRHLSELIGYKPEAVRVALHRLRKDGWIESKRQGRNSDYCLTDWGRTQSAEASPRIYANRPLVDRAWLVVLEPGTGSAVEMGQCAWLTSNVFLSSRQVTDIDALVMPVDNAAQLPDWMRTKLCSEDIAGSAKKLTKALSELETQSAKLDHLTPCERAVVRLLVVHDWRRIVLKLPVLPDYVFPKNCPLAHCRAMVAGTLRRLPAQSLDLLEQSLAD